MALFIQCLTVAGGLLVGYGLDRIIHRLPEALFPELRAPAASGRSEPGAGCKASVAAVMILGAAILTWVAWRFGFTWRGVVVATWLCGLVVLAGIDLRHSLLPDLLTGGLLGLALLAGIARVSDMGWSNALCGATLGYAVLWGLNAGYRRWRGVDGFGGGDLKMMAALGGWVGAAGVIDILALASMLALPSAALLARRKSRRVLLQTAIPFGPFLAIAAAALVVLRTEAAARSFTPLS